MFAFSSKSSNFYTSTKFTVNIIHSINNQNFDVFNYRNENKSKSNDSFLFKVDKLNNDSLSVGEVVVLIHLSPDSVKLLW